LRGSAHRRFRGSAAFSLLEASVGASIVAIALGSGIVGLTTTNRHADITRLYTCANTVAQNQIDRVLCNQYIPQQNLIPPELVTGTTTQIDVPVYVDPKTNTVLVKGELRTEVVPANLSYNTTNLHLLKVTVRLNYSYMGRAYSHVMHTLRTTDL